MTPAMQAPHRKPVPAYASQPDTTQRQRPYPPMQSQEQNYTRPSPAGMASHAGQVMNAFGQPTRRTLSSSTSSTSSTGVAAGLQRAPTNSSSYASAPRRSTSSRSASSASPTSYVALMRKQKATVWCDRAQHEDPRILAAQRAAKMRAAMEVAGGHKHAAQAARVSSSSSGMVGGVRSKIRHHGAPKASTYTGGALLAAGGGVPMRLSASEVDDDADSDDDSGNGQKYHSRTGSGRSSMGSGHKVHSSYMASGRGYSNGSTPPSGHSPVDSMGDLREEETPVPNQYGTQSDDYFAQPGGRGGSGSSGEERRFGGVGGLPQTQRTGEQEHRKTSEELRRRGSVDDRTMTMSAGRLFVANPDLSD